MWEQHGMSLGPITLSQSYAAKGFTMVTFQIKKVGGLPEGGA